MRIAIDDHEAREGLEKLRTLVQGAGGRVVLVGGCVRDLMLGAQPKDFDVEVYGIEADRLKRLLSGPFELDQVGASFGVLKLRGYPVDVALPRRESKAGLGHRAFDIYSDPWMDSKEAAARRDFTINSMGIDLATEELLDPWNGAQDLKGRILRHTSSHFTEDPLRVLRAMQFAARFDFEVAAETIALCGSMEPEGLPRERVYEEWKKLLLKGRRISRGLTFLRDCGWVRYYPELEALIGCEQNPEWHPEGDVWVHTLHCMDAFARERTGFEEEDSIVGFGVLCHDFGKPCTTVFEEGRWRSPGHDYAGEGPTRAFLSRLSNTPEFIDAVVALVLHHMRPVELYEAGAGPSAVRRLAARVRRIDRLIRVARADQMGRPPRTLDDFPAGDWLLRKAEEEQIANSAPKPLVMGRHLLELGLEPGKAMGEMLARAYQAQLDCEFSDLAGGLEFVRRKLLKDARPGQGH